MPEVTSKTGELTHAEAKKEQAPPLPPQHSHQFRVYFLSSITQGVITTGAFNWLDRGIYLATIHHRPLWLKANFAAPMQGCLQAMALRCCFGSAYYIGQGEARTHIYPFITERLQRGEVAGNIGVGLFAGTLNAIVTNPANAVKYRMWGDDLAKFIPTAKKMAREGGLEAFIRGTRPTLYRDMIFGSFYEVIRNFLRKNLIPENQGKKSKGGVLTADFACNSTSGIIATIFSSAPNYARNKQYEAPLHQPAPSTLSTFRSLNRASLQQGHSKLDRMRFFVRTFKIGPGTAAVGAKMAAGQIAFDMAVAGFEVVFAQKRSP